MRIFDRLESRLSIDADFSVKGTIPNEKTFFSMMKKSLGKTFRGHGLDVIDFKWQRRPKKKSIDKPDWWGGWVCLFKLVAFSHRGKSLEVKRRNALIPAGAASPQIEIEISEHEYCGTKRQKTIHGVTVLGYSRDLIVLEKIRAICQQSPDYKYTLTRNRARDFYDIQKLTQNIDAAFVGRCRKQIDKVFAAKEVPLSILKTLWDEAFIDEQGRGFDQVRDTVEGSISDFEFYVENLRLLVKDICPEHTGEGEFLTG